MLQLQVKLQSNEDAILVQLNFTGSIDGTTAIEFSDRADWQDLTALPQGLSAFNNNGEPLKFSNSGNGQWTIAHASAAPARNVST